MCVGALLISSASAATGDVSVDLQFSTRTVAVGDVFQMTVTVSELPLDGVRLTLGSSSGLVHFVEAGTPSPSMAVHMTQLVEVVDVMATNVGGGFVTATVSGTTTVLDAPLTVLRRIAMTLSSYSILQGTATVMTITLSDPPVNGLTVSLASTAGTFEGTQTAMDVTFAGGEIVHVTTLTPSSRGIREISATLSGEDAPLYAAPRNVTDFNVRTLAMTILSESAQVQLVANTTAAVTITLSSAPPTGITVQLSMSDEGTFDGAATADVAFGPGETSKVRMLSLANATTGANVLTAAVSGVDAALYNDEAMLVHLVKASVALTVSTASVGSRGTITTTLHNASDVDVVVNWGAPGLITVSTDPSSSRIPAGQLSVATAFVATTPGRSKLYATVTPTDNEWSSTVSSPPLTVLRTVAVSVYPPSVPVASETMVVITLSHAPSVSLFVTLSVPAALGTFNGSATTVVRFGFGQTTRSVKLLTAASIASGHVSGVVSGIDGALTVSAIAEAAMSLRAACSNTFSCPDGTCSATGTLTDCACTAAAAITNARVVSQPVPATVNGVMEVDVSVLMQLTARATYRRGDDGACSDFDFAPYMTVEWAFVPEQVIPSTIASNRSTIVFPAKHFTPGTTYTLRATLTPLTGAVTTVDFAFKAVAPTPVVSVWTKGSYLKVGPRNVKLFATITDAYADESAATWACTGMCGSAMTEGLSTNGTKSSVFLSGPLDAGTSYITLTYKGMTSAALELEVSATEVPAVSVVASVDPAVAPNTYLFTQALELSATVRFASSTQLSWAINGAATTVTSRVFVVPMYLLNVGVENTITVTATATIAGTAVSGESKVKLVLAANQTVTISSVVNDDSDGAPLLAGAHVATVSYSAPASGTSGATTFAVGYMQGSTRVVMVTTGELTVSFTCPIIGTTTLVVYVDRLINGHRVATGTFNYAVQLPQPSVLVAQLTALMSVASTPEEKARLAMQAASVMGQGDEEQRSKMLEVVLSGLRSVDPDLVDAETVFGAVKLAGESGGDGAALDDMILSLGEKFASKATPENCGMILGPLSGVPNSSGVMAMVGNSLAQGTKPEGPATTCAVTNADGTTVNFYGGSVPLDVAPEPMAVDQYTTITLPPGLFSLDGGDAQISCMTAPASTVGSSNGVTNPVATINALQGGAEKDVNGLPAEGRIEFTLPSADPANDACVYFDKTSNMWSTDGVVKLDWTLNTIRCATTHLTTFGAAPGTASSGSHVRWSVVVAVIAMLLQLHFRV